MPFGLKNARATFQRCMRQAFGDLVGWLVDAYVDDIVVKSQQVEDLVTNLSAIFEKLRSNDVKLNGVSRGMLLGFVI